MSTRTKLAYVAAALTLLLGLFALLNPLVMVRILGLEIVEPRGLSEIRSSYGALFLVLGGVMLWAISNRPKTLAYLRFAGFLWLGIAAGRLASILIDGAYIPLNLLYLLLELLIAVATLLAGFEKAKSRPLAERSPQV